METIFYVVRTTHCAYVYGSLEDAKAASRVMLDNEQFQDWLDINRGLPFNSHDYIIVKLR